MVGELYQEPVMMKSKLSHFNLVDASKLKNGPFLLADGAATVGLRAFYYLCRKILFFAIKMSSNGFPAFQKMKNSNGRQEAIADIGKPDMKFFDDSYISGMLHYVTLSAVSFFWAIFHFHPCIYV